MKNAIRSQERSPHHQFSDNEHQRSRELKISFRLNADYSGRLSKMSQAARTSCNQIARQLLVAALENPTPQELVQNLHEVGGTVEFLLTETHSLSHEVASLKVFIAASTELFLTIAGGLTAEDARLVIDDLFSEVEE